MPRLLLVDDEPLNIDMLKRRLERRGYEVITASNGREAVDRARADAPALVLMDVKMPVMDGYEATRLLKEDAATRGIPVIALTAQAMQDDRDKALAAGADEYESKPIALDQLLAKMQALLNRQAPA
jgi:two-component system, cell cycle response regulator DivK